jgi:hypothetical protein
MAPNLSLRFLGRPVSMAEVACLLLCGVWIGMVNLGLARLPFG